MNTKKPGFTITIKQEITRQNIGDLLCSAFEGGSNYWYRIEELHAPISYEYNSGEDLGKQPGYYKQIDFPLNPGGYAIISDYNGLDQGGKMRKERLDLDSIQRGLEAFANSSTYAHHWRDFISEDTDATTADVFLQFCLFGDVVYG